jgi:hypothetical protein
MASISAAALQLALDEVRTLLAADPTPTGRLSHDPATARVVGRACVVLLTSHLERYVRACNEEAIDFVNALGLQGNLLPQEARLLHSRRMIDELSQTQWPNRADKLTAFVQAEGWLWASGPSGRLAHDRLLDWMRSPKPDELTRYYRMWGLTDIFRDITRRAHTRSSLRLGIQELVDKRHRIAHGDVTAEATKSDVIEYVRIVETFCDRSDRALGQQLGRVFCVARPW